MEAGTLPAIDGKYDEDEHDAGEVDEELDARFSDAMALNARLKALLEAGVTDPAAAAEAMALARAATGMGGGAGGGYSGGDYGSGIYEDVGDEEYASRRDGAPRRRRSRGTGARRAHGGRSGRSAAPRSAPRSAPRAAPAGAAERGGSGRNFTFDEGRLNDIGRGNLRLMHNLVSINSGKGVMRTRDRKVAIRSSAAINRHKRGKKIMNENAAFLKRLQSVKASSALSRRKMQKDAQRQKKLAQNCRTVGVKKRKKKKRRAPDYMDTRASGAGFNF